MADDEILITARQCRAARGGLDWTRGELAAKAGVSLGTIATFERGERGTYRPNLKALRTALEAGGARFTNDGCVCFSDDEGAAE